MLRIDRVCNTGSKQIWDCQAVRAIRLGRTNSVSKKTEPGSRQEKNYGSTSGQHSHRLLFMSPNDLSWSTLRELT